MTAHNGNIARRVVQAILLFVGVVMLFINNKQTWARAGREHSRPSANNNAHFPIARGLPRCEPLFVAEARVKNSDLTIESLNEPANGLRR